MLLIYSDIDEEITPGFQCGLVDLIYFRLEVIQIIIANTCNCIFHC